jgi:hypothetical protein
MKEARSIVVRWQEAKRAVLKEQARLDAIAKAVAQKIKDETGQVVSECGHNLFGANHDALRGFTVRLESGWGKAGFDVQFPGVLAWTSGTKEGDHWSCSLRQCEALAEAMASIQAASIRLEYERSII